MPGSGRTRGPSRPPSRMFALPPLITLCRHIPAGASVRWYHGVRSSVTRNRQCCDFPSKPLKRHLEGCLAHTLVVFPAPGFLMKSNIGTVCWDLKVGWLYRTDSTNLSGPRKMALRRGTLAGTYVCICFLSSAWQVGAWINGAQHAASSLPAARSALSGQFCSTKTETATLARCSAEPPSLRILSKHNGVIFDVCLWTCHCSRLSALILPRCSGLRSVDASRHFGDQ